MLIITEAIAFYLLLLENVRTALVEPKESLCFERKKNGVSINEIGSECSLLIELVFISFHLLREKCFIRESNFVPIIELFSFHFVLLTVVCAYFP